ncbi:MAG: toxin-antitoxin system protein [Ruminococcaceae bacterium]|nr:toxin-antitoxin system protein [Oscillospiraceae bacterium]
MKPLKESISITLDVPVLTAVKTLSEQDDRSVSSYINQVLKAHLEKLEQQKQS